MKWPVLIAALMMLICLSASGQWTSYPGTDYLNPSYPVEAEGLIWRCVEDNTSFKVINNKYLLKENGIYVTHCKY